MTDRYGGGTASDRHLVDNSDANQNALKVIQETTTGTVSAAHIESANTTSGSAALVVKGGADLIRAHTLAGTQKFKVDQSGAVTVAAGTAASAPLTIPAGTNLTTAAAGAVEFDGTAFYATAAASSRQVVDAEQFQILTSANTLTNDTSVHPLFNATTNGTLTVAASTTYLFEMLIIGSGFSSSSHTLSLSFELASSASLTAIGYVADTAVAAAGAVTRYSVATNSATAVTASTTSTAFNATVRGAILVNHAGTIAPSITQGSNSAAASIGVQSYVRMWAVGSNTVTNVGDWG